MGNSNKARPVPGRVVPGPVPPSQYGQPGCGYTQPQPYPNQYPGCPVNNK